MIAIPYEKEFTNRVTVFHGRKSINSYSLFILVDYYTNYFTLLYHFFLHYIWLTLYNIFEYVKFKFCIDIDSDGIKISKIIQFSLGAFSVP